jgi:hypothetical protein
MNGSRKRFGAFDSIALGRFPRHPRGWWGSLASLTAKQTDADVRMTHNPRFEAYTGQDRQTEVAASAAASWERVSWAGVKSR